MNPFSLQVRAPVLDHAQNRDKSQKSILIRKMYYDLLLGLIHANHVLSPFLPVLGTYHSLYCRIERLEAEIDSRLNLSRFFCPKNVQIKDLNCFISL